MHSGGLHATLELSRYSIGLTGLAFRCVQRRMYSRVRCLDLSPLFKEGVHDTWHCRFATSKVWMHSRTIYGRRGFLVQLRAWPRFELTTYSVRGWTV